MNSATARLTLVCITCMMFLCFASTVSFGEVLMIFDDEATVDAIVGSITGIDPCDIATDPPLIKDTTDGYGDKVSIISRCAFVGKNAGWGYPIKENPAAGEYRYLTTAWKKEVVDAPGEYVMHQFLGDPGGWEHRIYVGDLTEVAKIWPDAFKSIAIDEELPREWTFYVVDLFDSFGEFTLNGMSFDTDGPNILGDRERGAMHVDAMYLTQTLAEAEGITSVEPAGKLATTWADIKAQH